MIGCPVRNLFRHWLPVHRRQAAAALNVLINTKNMADTRRAAAYNEEANRMLAGYGALADSIYKDISKDLQLAEEA